MKGTKTRILSLIMAVIILVCSAPIAGAAANNPMSIGIAAVKAFAGEDVDVTVSLKDNPGISSLKILLSFNSNLLTLKGVTYNTDMGGQTIEPQTLGSPIILTWVSPFANCDLDTTFATLTFEVDADAQDGDEADITATFDPEDIYNMDEVNVDSVILPGKVTVISVVPGDINGDHITNNKDLTRFFQYLAGWNVQVNEDALDTNGDEKVNNKDLTRLFQYLAGWNVELFPKIPVHVCEHILQHIPALEATCTEKGNTEYYQCNSCKKYFSDSTATTEITLEDTVIEAIGHNPIYNEAIPATTSSKGYTAGVWCDKCETWLSGHEEIEPLVINESNVLYRHYVKQENSSGTIEIVNDEYLSSHEITNPNPNTYIEGEGVEELIAGYEIEEKKVSAEGYSFLGWYEKPEITANRVYSISPDAKGNKILYGLWSKNEYSVQFDSPDVPFDNKPGYIYTVDKGLTLDNPKHFGYTFVGWSVDGKIVKEIKKGTTGHLTLHANWTSDRNKARAVEKLDSPRIIEDADNGRYVFVYEIGTIENVPLSTEQANQPINSEGIDITKELSSSKAITESTAEQIAKTVAKATTETSAWTLSEDWNSSTSENVEGEKEIGKTKSTTDTQGNTVEGKWYVSNSKGGSTSVSSSVGGSISNSSKVTSDFSVGINGEYSRKNTDGVSVSFTDTHTTEKEFNWNIGGNYGQNKEIGLGLPVEGIKASIKAGSNWGIEGGIGGVKKDIDTETTTVEGTHEEEEAFKVSNSRNFNVGTERNTTSEGHWDTSESTSSNWNSTSGYEASSQTSKTESVSNAISEYVKEKKGYSTVDETGGGKSNTYSTGDTASSSNEYASTVEFCESDTITTKTTERFKSSATGYYRVITAGTVHVFAVVGYDIATNSYFTYTYNVLDDERHPYLDYSKSTARFNDCENGIIPFEIPYEVKDFISTKISRSEGLTIDEQTGLITAYNGESEYVVIPEYVSASDGLNKSKAVKVTGIQERMIINGEVIKGPFEGKDSIKGIFIPKHIREIPENAFDGCSSLENVIAMGVTSIGAEAFRNCASLDTFVVDEYVSTLGENAFENVRELYVNAFDSEVAKAAFGSGAKDIIVYLSNMSDTLKDINIAIPDTTDFFALISDGRAYENISLDIKAKETFLSNIKFIDNSDIPLKSESEAVTLSKVIVEDSPGFSMMLLNPTTELNLYGNVKLSSTDENAILSKNVNVTKLNNGINGTMNINGNWLISGDITNTQNLSITHTRGYLIHIDDNEFANYLESKKVSFNSNGGNAIEETKTVYYGQTYGELPTPTRANYTFAGWYTEVEDGTRVTSETSINTLTNQTLYAHWTPNQFTLIYDANDGAVEPSSKTLTFGDSFGELPTPTRANYSFDGWYTAPNGGSAVGEDTAPENAEDITIYAHWTPNQFILTYDANEGTVEPSSKTLTFGDSYGTLPTPTRDYYTFDGWYTSPDGGSVVDENTTPENAEDITIYAHWILNDVSDWVMESEVPEGAQGVEEKWTYNQTNTMESRETSVAGYTQVSSRWVEDKRGSKEYSTAFPSGFDKDHQIYKDMAKSEPYSNSETATTKRVVTDSSVRYVYWHWMYDCDKANGTAQRAIYNKKGAGPDNGYIYQYFYAFKSTEGNYSHDTGYCNSLGITNYIIPKRTAYSECGGATRWFRFEYKVRSYVDYYKMFTYSQTLDKESTSYPTGENVSNIQKWVKYREK